MHFGSNFLEIIKLKLIIMKDPLTVVFNQIRDHVNYYHNQKIVKKYTISFLHFHTQEDSNKRVYSAGFGIEDNRIALQIKEDGGTRTVFNGFIYTFEQFLTVDACAR